MRTTVDIDPSILRELKRRAKRESKSLGMLISEIAAQALKKDDQDTRARAFRWISKPMEARVDLQDKVALEAALRGR